MLFYYRRRRAKSVRQKIPSSSRLIGLRLAFNACELRKLRSHFGQAQLAPRR